MNSRLWCWHSFSNIGNLSIGVNQLPVRLIRNKEDLGPEFTLLFLKYFRYALYGVLRIDDSGRVIGGIYYKNPGVFTYLTFQIGRSGWKVRWSVFTVFKTPS